MVAPARPLTSTAELADAIELRCPTPWEKPTYWTSAWIGRCNRLLSEVTVTGAPYQVRIFCSKCQRRTTFEVPARG